MNIGSKEEILKKENNVVFWKTLPILFRDKIRHIRKIGGRDYHSFIVDYGDVPGVNYNLITGKCEEVVNLRGRAYAARKRLKYKKKYKRSRVCHQ